MSQTYVQIQAMSVSDSLNLPEIETQSLLGSGCDSIGMLVYNRPRGNDLQNILLSNPLSPVIYAGVHCRILPPGKDEIHAVSTR